MDSTSKEEPVGTAQETAPQPSQQPEGGSGFFASSPTQPTAEAPQPPTGPNPAGPDAPLPSFGTDVAGKAATENDLAQASAAPSAQPLTGTEPFKTPGQPELNATHQNMQAQKAEAQGTPEAKSGFFSKLKNIIPIRAKTENVGQPAAVAPVVETVGITPPPIASSETVPPLSASAEQPAPLADTSASASGDASIVAPSAEIVPPAHVAPTPAPETAQPISASTAEDSASAASEVAAEVVPPIADAPSEQPTDTASATSTASAPSEADSSTPPGTPDHLMAAPSGNLQTQWPEKAVTPPPHPDEAQPNATVAAAEPGTATAVSSEQPAALNSQAVEDINNAVAKAEDAPQEDTEKAAAVSEAEQIVKDTQEPAEPTATEATPSVNATDAVSTTEPAAVQAVETSDAAASTNSAIESSNSSEEDPKGGLKFERWAEPAAPSPDGASTATAPNASTESQAAPATSDALPTTAPEVHQDPLAVTNSLAVNPLTPAEEPAHDAASIVNPLNVPSAESVLGTAPGQASLAPEPTPGTVAEPTQAVLPTAPDASSSLAPAEASMPTNSEAATPADATTTGSTANNILESAAAVAQGAGADQLIGAPAPAVENPTVAAAAEVAAQAEATGGALPAAPVLETPSQPATPAEEPGTSGTPTGTPPTTTV